MRTVSPSAAAKIKKSIPKVLDIPWKTKNNGIDCGVFLMRHMETYKGTSLKEWRCGFSTEVSGKQGRELNELRRKYIAKILLCDINRSKHTVEAGVSRYLGLTDEDRKVLDESAYDNIIKRLDG